MNSQEALESLEEGDEVRVTGQDHWPPNHNLVIGSTAVVQSEPDEKSDGKVTIKVSGRTPHGDGKHKFINVKDLEPVEEDESMSGSIPSDAMIAFEVEEDKVELVDVLTDRLEEIGVAVKPNATNMRVGFYGGESSMPDGYQFSLLTRKSKEEGKKSCGGMNVDYFADFPEQWDQIIEHYEKSVNFPFEKWDYCLEDGGVTIGCYNFSIDQVRTLRSIMEENDIRDFRIATAEEGDLPSISVEEMQQLVEWIDQNS